MAGIHFIKTLIHTCTVQRTTPAQSSSGELIDNWADVGNVACRYVQENERPGQIDQGFPLLRTDLLLMNIGEDVQEVDRITDIVFTNGGASVDPGPFFIEGLLERNTGQGHHISISLERAE